MGRAIFISYRRDDTEGEAGRLFDDLTRSLGENSVFMDVTGINPGMDFRKAIDDNVATCGALLAVIGPFWATIKDGSGTRRLDDPNDFVRLEIASALARNIAVIPVLVHEAKMPRPDELPDNLKDLAFRNSVEISHTRWNSDVQLLTQALSQYVEPLASTGTRPVHATVPVQLPPPSVPAQTSAPSGNSNLPMILGIVAAVVVALGIVGYFVLRPSPVISTDKNTAVVSPSGENAVPGSSAPANPARENFIPANSESFIGTWTNPAPEDRDGLVRMQIYADGNRLSIHAWGHCVPDDCDWNVCAGTMHGEALTCGFEVTKKSGETVPTRTATLAITPVNGQLSVLVTNAYKRKPPNQRQFTFVKAQ